MIKFVGGSAPMPTYDTGIVQNALLANCWFIMFATIAQHTTHGSIDPDSPLQTHAGAAQADARDERRTHQDLGTWLVCNTMPACVQTVGWRSAAET
jgi:hypothetical protein